MKHPLFPFSGVAGQEQCKLALILAAIYPAIGGVLVSGPRGAAKSTLARGMAELLVGGQEHDAPFVTLPLGASEEMLVGSLDLQQVLDKQAVAFKPGLLAKAQAGVLYVDEVNLLADNLVDLLLDVAASGVNIIERDGISHSHPARFLLMGTMNPDEGQLRPQLQDRFGLSVNLNNQYTVAERVEIVQRREAFDKDPEGFITQYQEPQQRLTSRIATAKALVGQVDCPDELRVMIAERCLQANVDGLRGDIVWYRAALAHCAWRASHDDSDDNSQVIDQVSEEDILAVEELVLAHRRQTPTPPQTPPKAPPFRRPDAKTPATQELSSSNDDKSNEGSGDWGAMAPTQQLEASDTRYQIPQTVQKPHERRAIRPSAANRKVKYTPNTQACELSPYGRLASRKSSSVDWFRTMISNMGQWPLKQLRFKPQTLSQPVVNFILLDTSASTLQQGLLAEAKAAVVSIAEGAYTRREQLVILGFGNDQVETLLSQQRAPKQLADQLDAVIACGGTPLREVLSQARRQQEKLRQNSQALIRSTIISDGRTKQSVEDLQLLGEVVVIDTENASVKRGRAQQIAEALQAQYFLLQNLVAARS